MKEHGKNEIFESQAADVAEAEPALKRPRRYKVILRNDDYTPMEFVVHVLMKYFHLNEVRATHIMFDVHTKGKGMCGVYTKEIAETKVIFVNNYSQINEHPLLCEMEPE
jgi:ATP-dependent Clp protease adaptor protein ClpS